MFIPAVCFKLRWRKKVLCDLQLQARGAYFLSLELNMAIVSCSLNFQKANRATAALTTPSLS